MAWPSEPSDESAGEKASSRLLEAWDAEGGEVDADPASERTLIGHGGLMKEAAGKAGINR